MKDKGIPLSPKHGVNPSMGVCFWCKQEDGTIALVGRMKPRTLDSGLIDPDPEAPRHAVYSREPCPKCKDFIAKGNVLVYVIAKGSEPKGGEPDEWMPAQSGFCVVTADGIRRMLKDQAEAEKVIRKGAMFISDEAAHRVGLFDVEPVEKQGS